MRFLGVLLAAWLLAMPATADIAFYGGGGGVSVVATAGPVSLTGSTSETNLAALKIPAGAIGKNGAVQIVTLWTYTNSSNNKTIIFRYANTSGTTTGALLGNNLVVTTTAAAQLLNIIHANNATNAQLSWNQAGNTPFNTGGVAAVALSVDTTQDSYININGILALGTETLTLQHAYAVVFPGK